VLGKSVAKTQYVFKFVQRAIQSLHEKVHTPVWGFILKNCTALELGWLCSLLVRCLIKFPASGAHPMMHQG
jgi:hypothetical protein